MPRLDYSSMFSYDPVRRLYFKNLTIHLPDGTIRHKRFMAKDPKDLYDRIAQFNKTGRLPVEFVTVEKMLGLWVEEKEKEVRGGTMRSYAPSIKHLKPFYNIRIDQLTTEAIQTRLQQMHNAGLAGKTIKTVKSCLGMAYDWIKPRYHGALQNPVNDVKLPKGMRAEKRHAPTDKETQRILDGIDSYFGFFYYMLVYTGVRRGELLGLTWDDLDLDAATIPIVKQVVYKSNKPIVTPLKTESSIRKIPILPPLLAELKQRRPAEWQGQYIFGAPGDLTKPMCESTLRRKEMHYCKEHGFVNITEIPRVSRTGAHYTHKKYTMTITPHMLRHCTATLCYEAGVDSRTAAALLGHSDPRITEAIYTELRQQHKQMELDKLVTYVDKKYGQDQTEHSDSTM